MAKREHFLREAMTIAIPVALQAMLQSSFSMIDQLMVGQFGKTAIAAVEVGGKPQFVFVFVSGAIATVTGIMVSQYMGKNDQKKINTSMSVNLLVMLCLALFTMGLCLIFPDVLAGIFTKDAEVVVTAKPYIQLLAWVYPLSGVATLLAVQLRCRNYARYPLYISAVAAVVNTCLNYLLIFGHFGFPAMGIKGAALASLMSQVVNLALMVYYLFTAISAGCLCGGGRQFSRRCFRCGSNGSHDTADHDPDIGNGISVKAAEERCRRICRCGGCIWCFG